MRLGQECRYPREGYFRIPYSLNSNTNLFMRYNAKAIGSGSEASQYELQDKWHKQMTLLEAQKLTLRVLKQVMEEKLDHHNVQLAQVTPQKGFAILDEVQLKEIIDAM
ncbi:uncharacterized protein EDB93DRAFT_1169080 [Suillus bovinus]|uniref:uncharacterized protein n=1 Tax=Suillus bovinus TaxID=48563 RepID=UPI001B884632|nr:uncharacterized protein EDB93DRAFT_1169080 [Suillus bovinus]KAG2136535.1 hypothetical protein EDB93DRAFT_1169080 [Suillus bovinus]